jgi:hypothetical protein
MADEAAAIVWVVQQRNLQRVAAAFKRKIERFVGRGKSPG